MIQGSVEHVYAVEETDSCKPGEQLLSSPVTGGILVGIRSLQSMVNRCIRNCNQISRHHH